MTAAVTRRRREHDHVARAIRSWPAKSHVLRHDLMLNGICPDCGEDAPRLQCDACGWEVEPGRRPKV